VLIVMNGSGSAGGVPRQVTGVGGATSLIVDNSVGFMASDLVLVSQSAATDCLLEQITGASGSTLTLGGAYYTSSGTVTTLQTLAAGVGSTYVTPLGNATANNLLITLYGVGSNRTLYSYDLLRNMQLMQSGGTEAPQAMADGVVQLHAIYGVDTDGDGHQDGWADAGLTTGYDITTVMTTPKTMSKILAVRVSLVLRTSYYDKNNGKAASPPTLTLFQGLTDIAGASLAQTITLSTTDQQYRYRVFEFTVPLRNMLLLAGGP
jgi:type IV pilus assembly protein PilW